jgi:hypothetical protein
MITITGHPGGLLTAIITEHLWQRLRWPELDQLRVYDLVNNPSWYRSNAQPSTADMLAKLGRVLIATRF